MKKPYLVALVASLAAIASAQTPAGRHPVYNPPVAPSDPLPLLSDAGKAAFNDWHLALNCEIPPPGVPYGWLQQFGARRFATNVIKWRIASGSQNQQYSSSAPTVMANLATHLAPYVTTVQTGSGDSTAHVTFKTGTSFVAQNGQVLPVYGCASNPFFADFTHPNTLVRDEIVCIPGAAGVTVLTHELEWHAFFTSCHMSDSNTCGGSSANRMPPPSGDCVPGQQDAVRWMYQVPPGSFPQ